jgi:hypothetical protein
VEFWHPLGRVIALVKEVEATIDASEASQVRVRITGLLVQ